MSSDAITLRTASAPPERFRIEVREGPDGDDVYVVYDDGREECIHSDADARYAPEDNLWRRDAGALFQLAFELGVKVGAGEAVQVP